MFVNATGSNAGDPYRGGLGGWVQALLSVSEGQTLYISVSLGEFGGGGVSMNPRYSGGGATDIRTIVGNLTSRLIVAGGGGGSNSRFGGNGGAKLSLRLCMYISTNLCLRLPSRNSLRSIFFDNKFCTVLNLMQEVLRDRPLRIMVLLVALKPLVDILKIIRLVALVTGVLLEVFVSFFRLHLTSIKVSVSIDKFISATCS